jgi:hypothetical protein
VSFPFAKQNVPVEEGWGKVDHWFLIFTEEQEVLVHY